MMMSAGDSLPDNVEMLKGLVRAREAELAHKCAEAASAEALIAHLRLTIEKLRREIFGPRNERKARLLEQLELELEELEAAAAENDIAGNINYGNVRQSATDDALGPSHKMKPVMRAGCNKHELRNDGCARLRIPVKINSQAETALVWIFLVERE